MMILCSDWPDLSKVFIIFVWTECNIMNAFEERLSEIVQSYPFVPFMASQPSLQVHFQTWVETLEILKEV